MYRAVLILSILGTRACVRACTARYTHGKRQERRQVILFVEHNFFIAALCINNHETSAFIWGQKLGMLDPPKIPLAWGVLSQSLPFSPCPTLYSVDNIIARLIFDVIVKGLRLDLKFCKVFSVVSTT